MNRTSQKRSDAEIRQLVIERLKTLPSGRRISVGSDGNFTKDELIQSVEHQTKVGDKIIQVQLEYLQSFKEGILFDD